jgi:F-type H+-transporting ATPase subunit gamma
MKMVAAARLRRAEERAKAARPYSERLQSFLDSFTIDPENLPHPLAEVRHTVHHKGLLVITSDRGLCGSYNSNILREAVKWVKAQDPEKVRLYIVGNKGVNYFKHRGIPIAKQFCNLDQKLDYKETKNIADTVANDFINGDVDDLDLMYSQFVSPAVCRQIEMHLLPICATKKEGEVKDKKEALADFIYEPSPEAILNILFPKYLYTRIVASLADSFASEQGQRMVAMTTATDNAEEMVKTLTLKYNKARQAAITKELGEIVGGAEALEK